MIISKAKEKSTPESTSAEMNFDTVLKNDVGEFGRYQLRTLVLSCVLVLFISWANEEYTFTTARTQARCKIPECDGDNPEFAPEWILNAIPGSSQTNFKSCQRYVNVTTSFNDTCPEYIFNREQTQACDDFVYEMKDSVAYEFDLACDEWKRTFIGTSRNLGAVIAQGLTGYISDRWGRRTALIFNIINTTWLGILRYWANSYIQFVVSEFIEALFGSAGMSCVYILAIEFVGQRYRMFSISSMLAFAGIANVILAAIAWQLPYWRHLTLALFVPMLISIVIFMFIDESVRWLISCGRFEKSKKILLKVAKVNKKQVSDELFVYLEQKIEGEQRLKKQQKEKKSEYPALAKAVLKNKSILVRCIMCPVWWIVMRLVTYGINVNSVNLSGNKYLNYAAVSMGSIPGNIMALLLAERFGRRVALMGSFWSCAACQIIFMFTLKEYPTLSLVVYVVGKMCIASVTSSLYVYTAELFPTRHRHSFFAFSSMIGRLGHVLAPMTPALADTVWEYMPYALFAGSSFTAGLLVIFTPETRNSKLPETIEELIEQK